jgi:hypothetical protein
MKRLAVAAVVGGVAIVAPASSAITPAQQRRANAIVAHAKRQGHGALRRLDAQVLHPARAADGSQPGLTPDRAALAVALYNGGTTYEDTTSGDSGLPEPSPPTGASFIGDMQSVVAHAAGCWGRISSKWSHSIAGGAIVERVEDWGGGWCGNGSQITYGSHNFYAHFESQYPYCQIDRDFWQGWDGTSGRWAHSMASATNGFYTIAVACVPVLGSAHRNLRIAGNGYWDRYDDYGF